MSTPKPSVGRVAHYVARGSADGVFPPACRAATITEVAGPSVAVIRNGAQEVVAEHEVPPDGTVGLAVLNPTGMFFHSLAAGGVEYDDGVSKAEAQLRSSPLCTGLPHAPGSWHWPARVDEDTARSAARGQRSMARR